MILPCLPGCGSHGIHLRQAERQGFLAQDVLARLDRLDGPFGVQVVGERVVDDVDFRVGQQGFVGAIGALDLLFARIGIRFFLGTAGNRQQLVAFR